jgi:hypothetical protein
LLGGDIETNPGPNLNEADVQSDSSDEVYDLVHINAQSLRGKVDLIQAEFHDRGVGVLAITETWLNDSDEDDNFLIPGFCNPIRRDRGYGRGGGICIYIRNGLSYKRRLDLENAMIECIWIECVFGLTNIMVGVFYNPKSDCRLFYENFDQCIDNLFLQFQGKVIILGDFNCDFLSENINHLFLSTLQTYGLHQIIDEPTRITSRSKTLIDLIIVNDIQIVEKCGVTAPFCSDHHGIWMSMKLIRTAQKRYKRLVWFYDRGDFEGLRGELSVNLVMGRGLMLNLFCREV